MADDRQRVEDTEVEGHLKTRGVEENRPLEPEDKVGPGRRGLDEDDEPEVEGHMKSRKVWGAEELGTRNKKTGA